MELRNNSGNQQRGNYQIYQVKNGLLPLIPYYLEMKVIHSKECQPLQS